ncbi:hypothetical protein MPH_12470 [Macrophomina phaseolina MS6]|uniref:Cytochrome P450 n=1 Tax=Macrophomina phaseolina (strain MS6) TaxID=1126212 RepID=K2QKI2_MACPH|nr:hypothetical protein MPH_12470 [Macrophomina phaseolina MS6]
MTDIAKRPVVRYAPDRIMIKSVTALKTVYGHGAPMKKAVTYDALIHKAPNTLTLKDKKEHGRRRRILAQGLSDASLRRFEPKLVELIKELCNQIGPTKDDGQWSSTRNMADWCNYLTFDIMASLIFGLNYHALTDTAFRHVVNDIHESNIRVSVLMQALELRFARLDRRLFPKSILARNSFLKFVGKLLRDRKQKPTDTDDLFSLLANMKDPETQSTLSPDQIAAESTTLVVAGTDTSSTAMASTFFYLSNNPDALDKACKEVRSKFPSGDAVRPGSLLTSCRYLRACIDEAMRLSPPVGSVLWREVQGSGVNVDGHFVPEGYNVGTAIYALHHDPQLYPRPFEYIPDRWLSDMAPGAQAALNPFSIGPRSCVGKGLALHEIQLVVATVLATFDLERVGPEEKEFELREHVTSSKDGPFLRFSYRKD